MFLTHLNAVKTKGLRRVHVERLLNHCDTTTTATRPLLSTTSYNFIRGWWPLGWEIFDYPVRFLRIFECI